MFVLFLSFFMCYYFMVNKVEYIGYSLLRRDERSKMSVDLSAVCSEKLRYCGHTDLGLTLVPSRQILELPLRSPVTLATTLYAI